MKKQGCQNTALRPEEKELDIFVLQDTVYIGLKPRFAGEVVSPLEIS